VQPANIAITLRRRSPWEAMDLGFTMLRRWWKPVFAAHAAVFIPLNAAVILACWAAGMLWLAPIIVWWLQPLYDRVVLHVLSRAVFGEVVGVRAALGAWREWLGSGLTSALFWRVLWWDLARSFHLPVHQLEGQRGGAARARKSLLGRRVRSYGVWLTIVWLHFEGLILMSVGGAAALLLPAQADRVPGDDGSFLGGMAEMFRLTTWDDAVIYSAVIFALEPLYVAAGFALYLNRRTLLEGWDVEVALRRIAEKHAVVLLAIALAVPFFVHAQDKQPKKEIAEVLKAKVFGYEREVERWLPKKKDEKKKDDKADTSGWEALGYALAKAAEVLMWIGAAALVAYALWWAARLLPRGGAAPPEPYRPPAALFGMDLAPETLPPDVAAAAAALAREGRLREALSLLYRGALSELVHKRGVRLLASHTEGDVLHLSGNPDFLRTLVDAWRACAYAQRIPPAADVERLASDYRAAFA